MINRRKEIKWNALYFSQKNSLFAVSSYSDGSLCADDIRGWNGRWADQRRVYYGNLWRLWPRGARLSLPSTIKTAAKPSQCWSGVRVPDGAPSYANKKDIRPEKPDFIGLFHVSGGCPRAYKNVDVKRLFYRFSGKWTPESTQNRQLNT